MLKTSVVRSTVILCSDCLLSQECSELNNISPLNSTKMGEKEEKNHLDVFAG